MNASHLSTVIASGTPVRVLDVPTPAEFENGHIAGAYNVPLDQLAEHAPELRAVSGGPVILHHRASSCDTESSVRRFGAADKAGLQ